MFFCFVFSVVFPLKVISAGVKGQVFLREASPLKGIRGNRGLLVENQVVKGKGYSVTFTFTNNTGIPIKITRLRPGTDISGFTLNTTETPATCKPNLDVVNTGTCEIKGSYTPDKSGNSIQTLSYFIDYFVNEQTKTAEAKKQITVQAGRFEYTDANNVPLSSLTLKANETAEVRLYNRGPVGIQNINMEIPANIANDITENFCQGGIITAGTACKFKLSISSSTAAGQRVIKTSSVNADNSPAAFYLNVLSKGFLQVTRNNETQPASRFLLKPDEQGTLNVKNIGGMDITNFSTTVPSDIFYYFPDTGYSNPCQNKSSLAVNEICTVGYRIPANPESGTFTLNFAGDNAENTPRLVTVVTASQGHIVFRHGSLVTTTVNALFGESGTITITNEGSESITNFSVTIPEIFSGLNYITSNSCSGKSTLSATEGENSCTIAYSIPSVPGNAENPAGSIYKITVNGNNFDNNDPSLIMSVLKDKPLYSFDFLSNYIHGNKVESNVAGLSSLSLSCLTSVDPNCNIPEVNLPGPKGINDAISFDGATQFAQFDDTGNIIGKGDSPDEGEGFTIDFWALFDSFDQSDSHVFDLGNGENSNNISIYHYGTGEGFVLSILRGIQGQSPTFDTDQTNIRISNFWKLGQWVHATLAVDKQWQVSVYRNGKPVDLNSPPIGVFISKNQQPQPPPPPLPQAIKPVERTKSYIGKSNSATHNNFKGKLSSVVIYKGVVPPELPLTDASVSSSDITKEASIKLPDKVAKDETYNIAFTFHNNNPNYKAVIKNTTWAQEWTEMEKDSNGNETDVVKSVNVGLRLLNDSIINGCLDFIPANGSCTISAKVKVTKNSSDANNTVTQGVNLILAQSPSVIVIFSPDTSATVSSVAVSGHLSAINGAAPAADVTNINSGENIPMVFTFRNTSNVKAEGVHFTVDSSTGPVTGFSSDCGNELAGNGTCQIYGDFSTPLSSGSDFVKVTLKYNNPDNVAPLILSSEVTTNLKITVVKIVGNVSRPLASYTEKNTEYPVIFSFSNEGNVDVNVVSVTISGLPNIDPDTSAQYTRCKSLENGTLYKKGSSQVSACEVRGKFKTNTPGSHIVSVTLKVKDSSNNEVTYSLKSETETVDDLYLFGLNRGSEVAGLYLVRCTINGTSDPKDCVPALDPALQGHFNDTWNLSIDKNTGYAFISQKLGDYAQIASCQIDSSTRLMKNCKKALDDASNALLTSIRGLAVNPATSRVYIADCSAKFDIVMCNQGSGGILTNCRKLNTGLECPHGLAFSSNGKYLYVSRYNAHQVLRCVVKSASGDIDIPSCDSMNITYSAPGEPDFAEFPSAITTTLSGKYVYFSVGTPAGYNFSRVYKCSLNPDDGKLVACNTTGSEFSGPITVTINRSETVAYISNWNPAQLVKCFVADNGDLVNCKKVPSATFSADMNIVGW